MAGVASNREKKETDTAPTIISRASVPVPNANRPNDRAATWENDVVHLRRSRYRVY